MSTTLSPRNTVDDANVWLHMDAICMLGNRTKIQAQS